MRASNDFVSEVALTVDSEDITRITKRLIFLSATLPGHTIHVSPTHLTVYKGNMIGPNNVLLKVPLYDA